MSKDKHCRVCGVLLTSANAYLNRKRGTPQSSCKGCGSAYRKQWLGANLEKEKARRRVYYSENKPRVRATNERTRVLRKYGLSLDEIANMRIAQCGLCAICKTREARAVDHDHATGRARELLCNQCNTVLGMMLDDPGLLRGAAEYIEKHRAREVAA